MGLTQGSIWRYATHYDVDFKDAGVSSLHTGVKFEPSATHPDMSPTFSGVLMDLWACQNECVLSSRHGTSSVQSEIAVNHRWHPSRQYHFQMLTINMAESACTKPTDTPHCCSGIRFFSCPSVCILPLMARLIPKMALLINAIGGKAGPSPEAEVFTT